MGGSSRANSAELASECTVVDIAVVECPAAEARADQGTENKMTVYGEPASFGTRLRVIILFALGSWALLAGGIKMIAG